MNVDWEKVHSVMVGDRWINVRDGAECSGDVSFELGYNVTMIASANAIQAVKINHLPDAVTVPRMDVWGEK